MTRPAAFSCLAVLAVCLLFSPCLDNGFLEWDDKLVVTENPLVSGSKGAWWKPGEDYYMPALFLSYSLEYRLFGWDPAAFHATNVGLHALNVLLLFWLLYALTRSAKAALAASLLFGFHPLTVEPAAWLSARKELLGSFFFLCSLLAYERNANRPSVYAYAASLVFFVLAVFSKPSMLVLPLVLFLADFLAGRRFDRKSSLSKAPFFLIAAACAWLGASMRGADLFGRAPVFSFYAFLLTCLDALSFYVRQALLPATLSARYLFSNAPRLSDPGYVASVGTALAIFIAPVWHWRRTGERWALFGCAFFVAALLPSLAISYTRETVADRYAYLPLAGASSLAAFVLARARTEQIRRVLFGVTAAAVLLFAFQVPARCRVWKDDVTLWSDVLEKEPLHAYALLNRGNAYKAGGEYEKALADFGKLLEFRNPGQAAVYPYEAWNNIGLTHAAQGNQKKALEAYSKALSLAPDYAPALTNTGELLRLRGETASALESFAKAIASDATLPEPRLAAGDIRFEEGKYEVAIASYEAGLRLDASNTDSRLRLGLCYAYTGRHAQALSEFERCVQARPDSFDAWNNLGSALGNSGQLNKAIAAWKRALGLKPDSAEVSAKLREAESLAQAVRTAPDSPLK